MPAFEDPVAKYTIFPRSMRQDGVAGLEVPKKRAFPSVISAP